MTALNREHTGPRRPGYAAYKRGGCRCYPCCAAAAQYRYNTDTAKTAGTWKPYADAEPVREHMLMLREAGIGRRPLSELSGVPLRTLQQLAAGKRGRTLRRVRAETARRILAVRPDPSLPRDRALVDSTGHRRRMGALVAAGFPNALLASRLGMSNSNFMRSCLRERIEAATDRAGRELYARLWDRHPAQEGVSLHSANRARNYARSRGWALPMAWDDDEIDDPAAAPDPGEKENRQQALAEDIAWIERTEELTPAETAARLGISREYLEKVRKRMKAA